MDEDLPIVDAHHHLWDLESTLRYLWLETGEHLWLGDYSRIQRTYLPAEYRRDTALHNGSPPSTSKPSATGPCNWRRPPG
jgi:predicted TIM-barrel fold metal-dependent hydrolase